MNKKMWALNAMIAGAICACVADLSLWIVRIKQGNLNAITLSGGILTIIAIVFVTASALMWRRIIIEKRHKRELEVKKLEEERLAEIQRLNEENQKKAEHFRSLLSHSLRMPVAVIQGYAELLLSDMVENEETKAEYLNKIVQRSQYMSEIISRNLTAEENIDSSKLNYAEVDILDISQQTAADMKLAADEKGVKMQVLSPDEKVIAVADSYLLRRVMFNLLENALKYMGRPGVVTIRVVQQDGNVTVSVQDDGLGLSEKETEHVFEYQFKGSNHVTGSGYGLYLVKKSIEAHGGTVSAVSSLGKGMGITFTIPQFAGIDADMLE